MGGGCPLIRVCSLIGSNTGMWPQSFSPRWPLHFQAGDRREVRRPWHVLQVDIPGHPQRGRLGAHEGQGSGFSGGGGGGGEKGMVHLRVANPSILSHHISFARPHMKVRVQGSGGGGEKGMVHLRVINPSILSHHISFARPHIIYSLSTVNILILLMYCHGTQYICS